MPAKYTYVYSFKVADCNSTFRVKQKDDKGLKDPFLWHTPHALYTIVLHIKDGIHS